MGRRLEEFYHSGGDVLARADSKGVERLLEKVKEKAEDGLKEKLQEQWMTPENPFLWDSPE